MMSKFNLTIWLLMTAQCWVFGQTWRSELYPSNWGGAAQKNFFSDKFVQDYSYAGYRRGEKAIPNVNSRIYDVSKSPYNADKSGRNDATSKIQAAIDAAEANGGGVVYLPAGTYRVSTGSKSQALEINRSNVVLRGDGPGRTFIYNYTNQMNRKRIIRVTGGGSWNSTGANATKITKDLMRPTRTIPVENTNGYAKGDLVIIRSEFTNTWVSDHKMQSYWGGKKPAPIFYCREVTAVNASSKTLTIDIPTRYALKRSYNATVYKAPAMIKEVGLEGFSIGNRQIYKSGFGESDYTNASRGAYDSHASFAIAIERSSNSWVRNVYSYKPSSNSSGAHLLSNGILVSYCKNVSLVNCRMSNAQYGGGGGNGYMFRISANETLLDNCIADYSRHGLVLSHARASGNVFYNCEDKNTKKQRELDGSGSTSGSSSDHHMHFSHSNLFDQCKVTNSWFEAKFRPYGSDPKHHLTAAHSMFWNINSNGNQRQAVATQQGRYGYVIGTSGNKPNVDTSPRGNTAAITNPVDHVEGTGRGSSLTPQSLYKDLVAKRLGGGSGPSIKNLALRKPVSTSGSQSPYVGNRTVDGIANNGENRWSASPFPQSLEVDLGGTFQISKTEVVSYKDRAYRFKVEAKNSQNGSYRTIVDRSNNTTKSTPTKPISNSFAPTNARYVKITITGAHQYTGDWVSIQEFRVFGTSGNARLENEQLLKTAQKVQLVPNPTEGYVQINLTSVSANAVVNITDMQGKTVKHQEVGNGTINLSTLKAGIYLVMIVDGTQTYTEKLVVK